MFVECCSLLDVCVSCVVSVVVRCCSLRVVCCVMFAVGCCWLRGVDCVLSVVGCCLLVFGVYCLLFVECYCFFLCY